MKRMLFLIATFLVAAVLFLATPGHVSAQGLEPDDGGEIIDVVEKVHEIAPFMWGNKVEVSSYKGIAIHHTVGGDSWEDAVINHLGWSRPPYMLVVEEDGRVYQLAVFGSETYHAGCAKRDGTGTSCNNSEWASISLVGDFRTDKLTAARRRGLLTAIRYLLSKGVPANIVGHQDLPDSATVCPGPNIMSELPGIRSEVGGSSGKIPAIVKPVEPPSVGPKVTATPKVQPAKIFGFPTYADSACEHNMRTALNKSKSWEISAGGSVSFTEKFGSFFGEEYWPAFGIQAGCVCEVATIFNYVASEAGLKPSFIKHRDGLLVPGVPLGYETLIYETGVSATSRDLVIPNTSSKTVVIKWTVFGDEIRVWTEGSSSSKSSSSSAPKPAAVTTPKPATISTPSTGGLIPMGTPEKGGVVQTIDEIVSTVKYIPGLEKVEEYWLKIKEYLPWIVGGVILIFCLTVVRPIIGWIANTRWGKSRTRKKKEFFWLSVFILVVYLAKKDSTGSEDLLLYQMFLFTAGIWLFFSVIGGVYKAWRHFNRYDPELEKAFREGRGDRFEWLKDVILGPVVLGVFVLIVAWTMAYYWFSAPILAIETKTKPINTSTPASPSLPSPKVTTPVPSNANWGSTTPLLDIPDSFKSEIRSLKDKVTRIALEEGVPPEVPFVLWLKEAGGRRVNPSNKEGLCGFYSLVKSGKASFTPGPITSESELLAQLRLCAQEFKKRSSGISYETTSLAALGPVYMRYNGNLDCYGEPYPSWDLHPYVMNGMDKDHSNMIARDGKGGCIALKIIGAIPAHIRVGMVLREK